MCSSYDYSTEAIEELVLKTSKHMAELMKNKWCDYFLTELALRGE